jgi:hypothetical protein
MALECGCIAQNCAYCDDGLRVILHQKANRVLHPLNGYVEASTAQPAHPADRFAREILAIVERGTMRSRRLMRTTLGGLHQRRPLLKVCCEMEFLPWP